MDDLTVPRVTPNNNLLLQETRRLVAAGRSLIPIKQHKAPAIDRWKPYQTRQPTLEELYEWFALGRYGIGILGGAISGNLEIGDFDATDLFPRWCDLVEGLAPGLLARLPVVLTPTGGRHVYYRCATIAGNQKLAQALGADGRPKTLIETRGEGGYVVAPPSPLHCHPLHKPYILLDGDLADIPTITPTERDILLNAARTFNEYVPPERLVSAPPPSPRQQGNGERPGDDFNVRATWEDMLLPYGWVRIGQRGEVGLWKRPGKREPGISATTNHADTDLLYVFSSNAHPFEPERGYNKFTAYTLLTHAGDFTAAAGALATRGYGEPHTSYKGEYLSPAGATHGGAIYGERWMQRQRAYVQRLRLPEREVPHD